MSVISVHCPSSAAFNRLLDLSNRPPETAELQPESWFADLLQQRSGGAILMWTRGASRAKTPQAIQTRRIHAYCVFLPANSDVSFHASQASPHKAACALFICVKAWACACSSSAAARPIHQYHGLGGMQRSLCNPHHP